MLTRLRMTAKGVTVPRAGYLVNDLHINILRQVVGLEGAPGIRIHVVDHIRRPIKNQIYNALGIGDKGWAGFLV